MEWQITAPNKDNMVRALHMDMKEMEWWDSSPKAAEILKEGSTIVLKQTGGMYWSGRGNQSYYATRFLVLRVKEIFRDVTQSYGNNIPLVYKCEELIEFPVRKGREQSGI